MRNHEGRKSIKVIRRLAVVIALVVAGVWVPHGAMAQGNTDEAHALCAQGGGGDPSGGAGGSSVGASSDNPDNLANETAAFGNGQGGSEAAGGAGGGGSGGGLGGAEGVGGGAGGCGPDISDVIVHRPVFVVERVGRRLPITGSPADQVAFMGGGLLLAGAVFVAASRRAHRRAEVAPAGMVWDAFGRASV